MAIKINKQQILIAASPFTNQPKNLLFVTERKIIATTEITSKTVHNVSMVFHPLD